MLESHCLCPISMIENPDKLTRFDPRIQTEDIGFDQKELIACGGCGRMNPPNRLKCVYCGVRLEIPNAKLGSIKLSFRKLEIWEHGVNVIFVQKSVGSPLNLAEIASILEMETGSVAAIIDAGVPLPLARVETGKDSIVLQNRLNELGLECLLISDDDLAPEKPPVRLGNIELYEGSISFKEFNTGKVSEIESDDLVLIVPGIIVSGRRDALEKKGRGRKAKLMDEIETASDESVLDLYTRRNHLGFRVHLTGFDFSCLGEDKGLIAAENLRRLIVALKNHSPNARLDSSYTSVRNLLGMVWEIESRKDPQGLQRSGFGKVEFGSVASTSNLNQFTKFSRLQWQLL